MITQAIVNTMKFNSHIFLLLCVLIIVGCDKDDDSISKDMGMEYLQGTYTWDDGDNFIKTSLEVYPKDYSYKYDGTIRIEISYHIASGLLYWEYNEDRNEVYVYSLDVQKLVFKQVNKNTLALKWVADDYKYEKYQFYIDKPMKRVN